LKKLSGRMARFSKDGRGAVRVVEALEGLRWGRAGQQDLAFLSLHQANILQAGNDAGDRALQEAHLLLEAAGMHWLLGADDEDQGADFVLFEMHFLNMK
jgi:hypothetical protein